MSSRSMRKRKVQDAEDSTSNGSRIQKAQALSSRERDSPPPKRGRGRPPKAAKGRGRPQKAVAAKATGEAGRLHDLGPWRRWGPYLSERQWGTVREDYSMDGNCWEYFSHTAATYRAYQWGEDGLFGFCDKSVSVCLSLALWNGKDEILKERLFGLTAQQGNHGEDVKELYYYVDAVPSHAYQRMLYKYPQAAFPYEQITEENAKRTQKDPEYELIDTGVFEENRYWDVEAEYVKASPGALICRYTLHNRGPETATITVLPQALYRNTWSWDDGSDEESPQFVKRTACSVTGSHPDVGKFQMYYGKDAAGNSPTLLFTNNETNSGRMSGTEPSPCTKDAFHSYVIKDDVSAVCSSGTGSKVAALYRLEVPAGCSTSLQCLLLEEGAKLNDLDFDLEDVNLELSKVTSDIISERKQECSDFYGEVIPQSLGTEEQNVAKQAYAGLLWTKQFFFYDVQKWLDGGGDPKTRINQQWRHMLNKDIISMPDKWEFPWYATWDLAFHMVPFGHVDLDFAKDQLLLFLSDRYMHPNGQLPAYEFAFSDVNPPVHAWACLHIYQQTVTRGHPDNSFLKKCFHRLLLNYNWWVNQKSVGGSHLYAGGFLGMDNITAVERSNPPKGTVIKQADGTGWMAFFSTCMMQIALQLAEEDEVYADMAARFLNQFLAITEEINGKKGLWDEEDKFYYDQLEHGDETHVLRVRSLVGLLPLVATIVLDGEKLGRIKGLSDRLDEALSKAVKNGMVKCEKTGSVLLCVPSDVQVHHILRYMLSEGEMLSPYGIRSLSKAHKEPFSITINDKEYSVDYCPGEGNSDMYGGNSNWRGPVWICLNFLLIEALQKFQIFYGSDLKIDYPSGSSTSSTFGKVADDVAQRIVNIFLPDQTGHRPVHGGEPRYSEDPHWKDLVLFNEYFHGDNGRGCGASHQTGWTALVVCLLRQLAEACSAD